MLFALAIVGFVTATDGTTGVGTVPGVGFTCPSPCSSVETAVLAAVAAAASAAIVWRRFLDIFPLAVESYEEHDEVEALDLFEPGPFDDDDDEDEEEDDEDDDEAMLLFTETADELDDNDDGDINSCDCWFSCFIFFFLTIF